MSTLTEAQKQRIEENRVKALQKRAAAAAKRNQSQPVCNASKSVANGVTMVSSSSGNTSSIASRFIIDSSAPLKSKNVLVCPSVSYQSREISNCGPSHSSSSDSYRIFEKKIIQETLTEKEVNVLESSKTYSLTQKLNETSNKNFSGKQCKANFVALSHDRFCVEVGYHQKVIETFKTIPSRNYDANSKKWSFSIREHDLLAARLKTLYPEVTFSPLSKTLVKLFVSKTCNKNESENDLSKLDPVLQKALLPFQKEGVNFGLWHKGRVLIADDMGLGKTIQAIAIANYYKSDWPLLVVTPSSVRYSWAEAFDKWLPSEAGEVMIINSAKEYITKSKIVLLSYDILTKKKDDILKRCFKSMIVDECHFLKNPKSARTKAAQHVMKSMNRIIMLSGTPALSRPIELFSQISAINPKEFPNIMEFGLRYCNGRKMPWGWDFNGSSNMEELQLLLEATVMIRRLKTDVLTQLPPKCRQIIVLDPSLTKNTTLKKYSKMMSKLNLKGMERRGILLEYFHQTGVIKIPAICEYISDLLEAGNKFIVFAHHRIVIDAICSTVEKTKNEYIRIDGSTSSEQRKAVCDTFQSLERCKVAVLSITAANAGITLTAAHLVVFAELFWNPGILVQAEDRAHRIGQEDSVVVRYLLAKGTADDEIWSLVKRKLDILSKVGLSKDNFSDSSTVCEEISAQPHIEDFWNELDVTDTYGQDGSVCKRPKISISDEIE